MSDVSGRRYGQRPRFYQRNRNCQSKAGKRRADAVATIGREWHKETVSCLRGVVQVARGKMQFRCSSVVAYVDVDIDAKQKMWRRLESEAPWNEAVGKAVRGLTRYITTAHDGEVQGPPLI